MAECKKQAITEILTSTDEGFVTLNCITKTQTVKHMKVCRRFLSAYSDQMKDTIANKLQTPQSSINCEISGVEYMHWELFIRFCYGDTLILTEQNVVPLLAISIKLIVPTLKQQCLANLVDNIHLNYGSNHIFQTLQTFGFVQQGLDVMLTVTNPTTALIRAFFDSTLAMCLSTDQLLALLSQTSITENIEPETIWDYVTKWHKNTKQNEFITKVKDYIQFTAMKPQYFAEFVDSSPYLTLREKYEIWKQLCLQMIKQQHVTNPKKRNRSQT